MRRRHTRQSPLYGSGLGLLSIGFAAGIITTSLYLGLFRDPPSPLGSGIRDVIDRAADGEQDTPSGAEVPVTGEASTPGGEAVEPEFGFYTILPDIEHVPAGDVAGNASSAPPSSTPTGTGQEARGATEDGVSPSTRVSAEPDGAYVLQVGAYTSSADADSVRARLGLLGFESYTLKVSIEGRGTFYRVRIGPFNNREALQSVQKELRDKGTRSVSVKIGNGGSG